MLAVVGVNTAWPVRAAASTGAPAFAHAPARMPETATIGHALSDARAYAMPLAVASFTLLIAIVGASAVARRAASAGDAPDAPDAPEERAP
jgi:NADH:ubiquinone oxidoreductase subunit 6 (subunit J)